MKRGHYISLKILLTVLLAYVDCSVGHGIAKMVLKALSEYSVLHFRNAHFPAYISAFEYCQ